MGGSFAFAALGAVVAAATELREQGTYGWRAGGSRAACPPRVRLNYPNGRARAVTLTRAGRYTCGTTSEAISARWSRSCRSSTCR